MVLGLLWEPDRGSAGPWWRRPRRHSNCERKHTVQPWVGDEGGTQMPSSCLAPLGRAGGTASRDLFLARSLARSLTHRAAQVVFFPRAAAEFPLKLDKYAAGSNVNETGARSAAQKRRSARLAPPASPQRAELPWSLPGPAHAHLLCGPPVTPACSFTPSHPGQSPQQVWTPTLCPSGPTWLPLWGHSHQPALQGALFCPGFQLPWIP